MRFTRKQSALLDLFPRWSTAPAGDETSRDPLGFQRYAGEFATRILPGITVVTVRARQYSFICWAVKLIQGRAEKSWQADRPITNDEFVTLYNRFEKVLALSEAVRHHGGANGCHWIGERKTRAMVKEKWSSMDLGFRLVAAERRGGGLARYQSSLSDIGLLNWEIEKSPLIVTETGSELADAFARALKTYARDIAQFCLDLDVKAVRRSDLARWGKRFCLSELSREEARILRPLLVSDERATTLNALRQLPRWLTHDETSILQNFYSCPETEGRAFDLKQIQYYQYFFVACLTLFYSLFHSFEDAGESRKKADVLSNLAKGAGLAGEETVKDVARRVTAPGSLLQGDELSLVGAFRLLRTVWEGAKKQPGIWNTAPKVESLAVEDVGQLLDDFSLKSVGEFLSELVDLILSKHKSVFGSKGKFPWITLSGDSVTVHEFDAWHVAGNPYQVHVGSMRSLVRDLEHAHD
jgi:hypothetical protein